MVARLVDILVESLVLQMVACLVEKSAASTAFGSGKE